MQYDSGIIRALPTARLGAAVVVAAAGFLWCTVCGCVSHRAVAHCPLDQSELSKQILAIAPVGTPRDEAVRKLREAGIAGEFGSKSSKLGQDYYCCQSWRRANGETWRLSMLLHFDAAGKLTETLELPDISEIPKSKPRRA